MTFIGILGMLLGLLALSYAWIERTRVRVAVFAGLFLSHTFCAFVYHSYAVNYGSDASIYYYGYEGFETGFGTSTQFIIYITQAIKTATDATYLDLFLVFHAFGFFGVALLMRTFEEVFASVDLPQPTWSYFLLFLPGINFWTSAIGKDGLLFTACCLAAWAVMNLRRRYVALAAAVGLMILIRPHIAVIAVVAAAWTVLADRTSNALLRGTLVLASLGGLVVAAATMKSTFALDVTSADSISDFLAVRENALASSDDLGNTAVLDAPYPVRVLSFLFRPLFLDAEGAFGYIASFENTVFLFIFGFFIVRFRILFAAVKRVPFLRYATIFGLGVTLALAIDYYNVGLGLRQKTMVVPAFLVILVAIGAVRAARRRAAAMAGPIHVGLKPA